MNNQLANEYNEQPQFLRKLAHEYQSSPLLEEVCQAAAGATWVLTGMGASFHAASIGALHLNSLGVPAYAIEATDLTNYASGLRNGPTQLVYISQSGSSGELGPFLANLPAATRLTAITNNPESDLARRASWVLPMVAGDETLVATKTYINPLAILWLLARRAGGKLDGSETAALEAIAGRVEAILQQSAEISSRLVNGFDLAKPLLFLGHGPHAYTARHAAMVMSEWSKLPAMHAGIGAYRHGYIETIHPGCGVIIFAAPGRTCESALTLSGELSSYGARVLLIENGLLREVSQSRCGESAVDEFLSPILDIIPIQIFTDALAKALHIPFGFRYIGKVVRAL